MVLNLVGCCGSQASNVPHAPALYGQRACVSIVSGWVEARPDKLYADEYRQSTGRDWVRVEVDNSDHQEVRAAHMLNFLDCVKTRAKPIFDADFGYRVMVAIKLGVDSYRTGRLMHCDSNTERILDRARPRHSGYEGDGATDPVPAHGYRKRSAG